MELKNGAIALLASSLLFLALAFLTDGLIFYLAFAGVVAVLGGDALRYVAQGYYLKRTLRVTKQLSRSDMLLGSTLTITYHIDYDGTRPMALYCSQIGDLDLGVKESSAYLVLGLGSHTLEYVATPSARGRQVIKGLSIALESMFYKGTMMAGGDHQINVYPVIDVRPERMSGRAAMSSSIGNEAIRQGSGTDFSHIRYFTPGDSTRDIDWARSSRYGELVVKAFEDVRSRPVFMLIDVDASMATGDKQTQLESSVELITMLAGRVLMENERVGMACFSRSEVKAYLPLAGGKGQMTRIRQLLASVRPDGGDPEPRGNVLLQEAVATRKAFGEAAGLDALSDILEESIQQFMANVKEDGFVKAIFRVSRSSTIPCHIVVSTNLSMGLSSLLDGARIAKYYGHNVTVALTPGIWYEQKEGMDAEKYYRQYREAMENIACLRAHRIDVIELSASEKPEEAMLGSRARKPARMLR